MIHIIEGNLLTALKEGKVNVIGHQCNCFSEMGAGIAKQIKQLFPDAYEVDKEFPYSPEERLGKMSCWTDGEKSIFNLYGQFRYDVGVRQTDYDALKSSMEWMLQEINQWEDKNGEYRAIIGFPYFIGSGLAGGEWEVVEKIIENVFVSHGKREVFLYKLKTT